MLETLINDICQQWPQSPDAFPEVLIAVSHGHPRSLGDASVVQKVVDCFPESANPSFPSQMSATEEFAGAPTTPSAA